MCDIVGLTIVRGNGKHLSHLLKRMTDSIKYRGPDDEGQEVIGNVGLGHRRLILLP